MVEEDRTLAEELAVPEPAPAPTPRPRKPDPAPEPVISEIVEEVRPEPAPRRAAPPKPAAPAPRTETPAAPAAPAVTAPAPAAPVLAKRLPPVWEEGPQPQDLLKPGPGVEQPVPLDFPRYSYPSEARGTGLIRTSGWPCWWTSADG